MSLLKTYMLPFSCPLAVKLPLSLRATHSPKLPFVSYSRIRGKFCVLSRLQTLILPLMLLLARY